MTRSMKNMIHTWSELEMILILKSSIMSVLKHTWNGLNESG